MGRGDNALRPAIAAVSARIEQGTLRILEGRCPNLLAEAGLYRYGETPAERNAEVPVDEHNHALAALRYLISRLDARRMALSWPEDAHVVAAPMQCKPMDGDDERYWVRLN